MEIDTPVYPGVTLEELLAAKETRAGRQQAWLARYGLPVISLSLVTPGPVKDSVRYRNAFAVAVQACDQLLWQHRWPWRAREVFHARTGPTALWSVAHPASEIKALCVELEQTHPLGRVWDFDIHCPQAGQVGRASLDRPGRRCLLCDEPAHACARSRRHPRDAVVGRVEKMIDDWFTRD